MALTLGLTQIHWGGALVPRGSPTCGLTHRPTESLRDQHGSHKVCWQLNQHLAQHIWRQSTQEPIQHLRWRCVGDTQ